MRLCHQIKAGDHHLQVAMFDRCISCIRISEVTIKMGAEVGNSGIPTTLHLGDREVDRQDVDVSEAPRGRHGAADEPGPVHAPRACERRDAHGRNL